MLSSAMAGHDIVVLGASAGGIEPLKTVVAALPRDLPAGLFAVVRQFEQRANLQRAMAEEQTASGRRKMAAHYGERAAEMEAHATVLRTLLLGKAAA